MNVIGALKRSGQKTTVYFCEYEENGVEWQKITDFLDYCRLNKRMSEKDIYCLAISSNDNMNEDKNIVGMICKENGCFENIVPENSDLEIYLNELSERSTYDSKPA